MFTDPKCVDIGNGCFNAEPTCIKYVVYDTYSKRKFELFKRFMISRYYELGEYISRFS